MEWIKAERKKPEENVPVLVWDETSISLSWRIKHPKRMNRWIWAAWPKDVCWVDTDRITHWMPIPDPPGREKTALPAEQEYSHKHNFRLALYTFIGFVFVVAMVLYVFLL